MPIAGLKLTNLGPFDDIAFEFDRQVNVFTGPNNSGKSAILWALGDILVANFEFPRKLLRAGKAATFDVRSWDGTAGNLKGQFPISSRNSYWKSRDSTPRLQLKGEVGYTNFVPALRESTDFRSHGPTSGHREIRTEPSLDEFFQVESYPESPDQQRTNPPATRAAIISDAEVVQQIIDLDYRSYRRNEPASRAIIGKMGELAAEITEGFPIKFLGVAEDGRGLFPQFHTPDGELPLNALSQGTQSLIQWLAHFLIGYAEYYDFPESLEDKPGLFIVDEIDAHLHPSWQRRIIPALTRHFPSLQIFCSTHSPLMLAGLKEGQAQLLRRDDRGKVVVSRNEGDIIGWSMDEITRILLDVPDPTDLATVEQLKRLQELRRKQTLSAGEAAELEQLRRTVNQDLLGGPMAQQLEQLTELLEKAKAELISPTESATPPAAVGGARRRRPPAP